MTLRVAMIRHGFIGVARVDWQQLDSAALVLEFAEITPPQASFDAAFSTRT